MALAPAERWPRPHGVPEQRARPRKVEAERERSVGSRRGSMGASP